MKIDELVAKYIALRDKIAEEEATFKAAIADKKAVLDKVEEVLKKHFEDTGTDTVTVRGVGTAYKTMRTSTSVAVWDDTLDYIKQHEAWDLLEHRVNKTAAMEHLKENGELPPGVNMSQQVVVNIRRS